MRNSLTFDVEPGATTGLGGALVVTPKVGGITLVDLVGGFEARLGYEPSGGYGGIVSSWFRLGDLEAYHLGREAEQWPRPGHAWLRLR